MSHPRVGALSAPSRGSGHITRADFTRADRLRPAEFEACWARLDLGEVPLPLSPLRPPGHTIAERDRARRDALATLAGRGLADQHGPGPALAGALRLLATASILCDLRCSGKPGGGDLIALGAVHREHGIVLLAESSTPAHQLNVLPVPGPHVPTTLVELVGPLHPARARPVNVPADLFDRDRRAATDLWALADRLVASGVASSEANALARMCTGLTAAGQFGVTARGGGRERRGRWVIGFHRGHGGACLQLRRGGDTVTIAPLDAPKLLAQLTELIEDTRLVHA